MSKFKLLILNTLPITSFDLDKGIQRTAGNQTLYNTLKGYNDNNIRVLMITFCDTKKIDRPFKNVVIRQSFFYPFFKVIMSLKVSLKKYGNKNGLSSNTRPTVIIKRVGRSLISILWSYLGVIEGTLYSIFFKPDIFYGYEIHSTIPSKRLSVLFNKPLVTRFQGTELGFFLSSNEIFFSAKDYIEGTKILSDLIIMANDGTDGDKVLNKLGMDNKRIKFWMNGLHDKQAYLNYEKDLNFRSLNKLSEDSIIICTANRFVDWKRIDRILFLMKELELIIPNAVLLAIGDGPEMVNLLKLCSDLKINNIKFLGVKEHKETIYHIANSDLYITLNHSGNLGNSILESLALGVPIITIENDSVKKVLKNNFNSILIKENKLSELPFVIKNLFENKNKLREIKINSKLSAEKHLLSWDDRMKKEVEELFHLINK